MEKTIVSKECNRCGHKWIPRNFEEPLTCPACSSPYWNRARIRKLKKKADASLVMPDEV